MIYGMLILNVTILYSKCLWSTCKQNTGDRQYGVCFFLAYKAKEVPLAQYIKCLFISTADD